MNKEHKNSNLIKLGQHIREQRKSLGLTQETLALSAGIDRSYIGGIERGERNVSFLTLINIAQCLPCDLQILLEGIPDE